MNDSCHIQVFTGANDKYKLQHDEIQKKKIKLTEDRRKLINAYT